ncbi:hypothetical protein M0805_005821 [Coniferiporia weirii]|nr:hypothetical protein M0805_005821 [Coniferiporia weirii]
MTNSSSADPYADRLSLQSLYSASSNGTVDNLPGAGRILGNVYSFTGRRLEKQLGSIAERLGYGPRATAFRIQRRRKAIDTYPELPPLPRSFKTESKKIEKDCRRLLKYVRSNVASTKKQALDHITELSIDDSYIRSLFKVMGAVNAIEPLQRDPALWIYYGSSLQNSSRKALVSLVDVEINTLAQKVVAGRRSSLQPDLFQSIATFLYDSDRSFLAVRHIRRLFERFYGFFVWSKVIEQVVNFIGTSPDEFEWEEGDQLLKHLLEYFVDTQFPFRTIKREDVVRTILEKILRYADKLPRTTSSKPFQRWLAHFDEAENPEKFLHAHYLMHLLMQGIVCAGGMSEVDPDDFRVDLAHLQAIYPHARSELLLRKLACPPDLVLCKIAYRRRSRIFPYNLMVLDPPELRILCLELACHADSDGGPLRERALRCAGARVNRNTGDVCGGACASVSENVLKINTYDVLELCVPHGTAFSSKGHYPLFAGYTTGGKPAYVAKACLTNNRWTYCAVTEGTRPEDLRIPDYSIRVRANARGIGPESLVVYVLRYVPAAYTGSRSYDESVEGGEEGLDATGPFFWKPVWDESYISAWKAGEGKRIVEVEAAYANEGEYSSETCDWEQTEEECDSDNEDWKTVEEEFTISVD